jgi:FkbM family methyltransferase
VGPEGSVFAFEPDPVARARLERNIALNKAHNVEVVPIALSREAGSAKLAGGLSEATVGTVGDVDVETVSLPGFIARTGAPPDLIKVDIEGGEADLERSALRDIAAVFIEIHAPEFRRRGIDPEAFLEEIAGDREITRLEGNVDNYNVCIVS